MWVLEGLRAGIYDYIVLRRNAEDVSEIPEFFRRFPQPVPINSAREDRLEKYAGLTRFLLDYAEGLE